MKNINAFRTVAILLAFLACLPCGAQRFKQTHYAVLMDESFCFELDSLYAKWGMKEKFAILNQYTYGYEGWRQHIGKIKEFMDKEPQNEILHHELYEAYMNIRHYDEAEAVAEQCLGQFPHKGAWLYAKAVASMKMGESLTAHKLMEQTLSCYEKSLKERYNTSVLSFTLTLKCFLGRNDEALGDLRDNLRLHKEASIEHADLVQFAIKDFDRFEIINESLLNRFSVYE